MLSCECGFAARAADEDGLVAEVRRHAWEAHGMALSHDDALVLAFHGVLRTGPVGRLGDRPIAGGLPQSKEE